MEYVRQLECTSSAVTGRPLSEFASALARLASEQPRGSVIGITGPSSVGKSSFAATIARQLAARRLECEVISVDDFLQSSERGGKVYRRIIGAPLAPEDLDFHELRDVIAALRRGKSVTRLAYVRGDGWGQSKTYRPADAYVVEGLFLDAAYATRTVACSIVVVLDAPWDSIADLRRKRDAAMRVGRIGEFRSPEQTEAEIATTRKAYLEYHRDEQLSTKLIVRVDFEFNVVELSEPEPASPATAPPPSSDHAATRGVRPGSGPGRRHSR